MVTHIKEITPADDDPNTRYRLYGPYPTLEEVMSRRLTLKVATRISPALHKQAHDKSDSTGIPLSVVIRRALKLWVEGKLDALLTQATD